MPSLKRFLPKRVVDAYTSQAMRRFIVALWHAPMLIGGSWFCSRHRAMVHCGNKSFSSQPIRQQLPGPMRDRKR